MLQWLEACSNKDNIVQQVRRSIAGVKSNLDLLVCAALILNVIMYIYSIEDLYNANHLHYCV
jgi:hypothetical protein